MSNLLDVALKPFLMSVFLLFQKTDSLVCLFTFFSDLTILGFHKSFMAFDARVPRPSPRTELTQSRVLSSSLSPPPFLLNTLPRHSSMVSQAKPSAATHKRPYCTPTCHSCLSFNERKYTSKGSYRSWEKSHKSCHI